MDRLRSLNPTVVADLTNWSWIGPRPDLVWASPPCTEYSRESMPWCRTGRTPDLTLWRAAERIIAECRPRFWAIENVRGAQCWHGRAITRFGPFYLWGEFPQINCPVLHKRPKSYTSGRRPLERARLPLALSRAIAQAIDTA